MSRGLRALGASLVLIALAPVVLAPPAAAASSSQDRDPEAAAAAVFAEADAFMRLGEDQEARDRLDAILRDYPAAAYPDLVWRAAAAVRRADLHRRNYEYDPAAALYVDVVDGEPGSEWSSRARMGLAAIALESGNWIEAADLLQQVISAAERGTAAADAGAADEARRRLSLLDRFRVRTWNQERPWNESSVLSIPGTALDRPVAVAASSDGQLLVVDEGLPAVLLVDALHSSATRLNYNDHERPWWGADGLPYLPTRRAGVISLGGARVGFLATEGGRPVPLKELRAGDRSPNGDWYLLDGDPARVLAFGAKGAYLGRVTTVAEEPGDVAVDDVGRLYVLNPKAGVVVGFRPDGSRERIAATGQWRRAEALAVDALANLYVLDRDSRTIDVFDAAGQHIQTLGPTLPGGVQLRQPRDLGVDGLGRIFVADRGASAVVMLQ